MDHEIPRGRSPSQGLSNRLSPQPSPHRSHDATSELGLDPAVQNSTFTSGKFTAHGASLQYASAYSDPAIQAQTLPQATGADSTLYQNSHFNQSTFQNNQSVPFPGGAGFDDQFLQNHHELRFAHEDTTMQGGFGNTDFALDPAFDLDQQSNVNPANLSKMPSSHASTPPNLLSPENHSSPGQPGSPASTQGQFYTPQHSRHQSLDPASAAYPPGSSTADWQGMTFQHHRKAPSDQSDFSSNAPSPFLPHTEPGESLEDAHSPTMGTQQDGLNAFGIEGFSINDHQQPEVSPGHSPYISPRLTPQQSQGLGMAPDFMLLQNHMPGPGPEIYTTQPDESLRNLPQMHVRNTSIVSDMGQADQFPAPTINIEPAPVSRQGSFEPERNNPGDNLSPPARPRGRSQSDPHVGRPISGPTSRSTSPAGQSHSASPGTLSDDVSVRSFSPGLGHRSRESSPGPSTGRVEKNRRQSTSSITSRDYILDLADPSRPNASPSHSSTRVQKHPATFQCNLCPKRFTRAYNLRSHLRTHTDERPFVCTVCDKAFARQHDRKRHEGLHSGEKKFVCRGELGSGGPWGCGRKFARADALGRHFRSEAGRICIKPLLDEEAAERARKMMLEQQQHALFAAGSLLPVQQPMMMNIDAPNRGGFALPAALLAQYPALNNIDWSAIPQGDDAGDLSDVGMGTGSFDASNGGSFGYDESDVNESYAVNSGMSYAGGGGGSGGGGGDGAQGAW